MKLNRHFILAAWLLICAEPIVIPAQQPFITDDADVTARGGFHLEFSNSYNLLQRSTLPAVRQNTASFELGYGVVEGVEVSLEVPFISIFNTGGTTPRSVSGIGDANFAVKYNFLRERKNSRLPALTVSGNIEIPIGSVRRGLGSGVADYSLNGVVQKTLNERMILRGNAGVIFSGNTVAGAEGIRAHGTIFTGGASLVRRFNSRLQLGAELAGAATRDFDLSAGQLVFQVGGNHSLRDNLTFDFGILAGRFVASSRAGAQLGFSLDF